MKNYSLVLILPQRACQLDFPATTPPPCPSSRMHRSASNIRAGGMLVMLGYRTPTTSRSGPSWVMKTEVGNCPLAGHRVEAPLERLVLLGDGGGKVVAELREERRLIGPFPLPIVLVNGEKLLDGF
jgi:hypothetical protein